MKGKKENQRGVMIRFNIWFISAILGWLWMTPSIQADIIPDRQIPIYAAKLGVQADMESLKHDLEKNRTHFEGTVTQPCKLKDLGFGQVESGGRLEVTSLETGRWEAKLVSTGQVKEFDLAIEWTKEE
jgi:hypothetical protein